MRARPQSVNGTALRTKPATGPRRARADQRPEARALLEPRDVPPQARRQSESARLLHVRPRDRPGERQVPLPPAAATPSWESESTPRVPNARAHRRRTCQRPTPRGHVRRSHAGCSPAARPSRVRALCDVPATLAGSTRPKATSRRPGPGQPSNREASRSCTRCGCVRRPAVHARPRRPASAPPRQRSRCRRSHAASPSRAKARAVRRQQARASSGRVASGCSSASSRRRTSKRRRASLLVTVRRGSPTHCPLRGSPSYLRGVPPGVYEGSLGPWRPGPRPPTADPHPSPLRAHRRDRRWWCGALGCLAGPRTPISKDDEMTAASIQGS